MEVTAQADKVEMLFQALKFEEEIDPTRLDQFWKIDVEGNLPSELVMAIMMKRRGKAPEDGH